MFVMIAGRHLGRGALGWALVTGVFIASYTVIDAHGVRAAPSAAELHRLAVRHSWATAVVAMFAIATRGAVFAAALQQWRPGVIAGALSIVTYGMALEALSIGPTAPLAALRETGMVTALLIAVLVLKERATPGRIAGILGILGGAALILVG